MKQQSNIPQDDSTLPDLEITENAVYEMACKGISVELMAAFFECEEEEITETFARALKKGQAKYEINVLSAVAASNDRLSPLILNKSSEKVGKKQEANEFLNKSPQQIREFLKQALEMVEEDDSEEAK